MASSSPMAFTSSRRRTSSVLASSATTRSGGGAGVSAAHESPRMTAARLSPRGLAAATAAFGIWGLFPVYLHPLSGVPALQVIAHRVAWACVFIFGWLLLRGELAGVSATLTNARLVARLTLTALLISGNWLVYVWSVTHAHIVDTSLGYYINPLV